MSKTADVVEPVVRRQRVDLTVVSWTGAFVLGGLAIAFVLSQAFPTNFARNVSEACDGLHQMIAGVNEGDAAKFDDGFALYGGATEDLDDSPVPNADTGQDQQVIWNAASIYYAAQRNGRNQPLTASEQGEVDLGLSTCEDY